MGWIYDNILKPVNDWTNNNIIYPIGNWWNNTFIKPNQDTMVKSILDHDETLSKASGINSIQGRQQQILENRKPTVLREDGRGVLNGVRVGLNQINEITGIGDTIKGIGDTIKEIRNDAQEKLYGKNESKQEETNGNNIKENNVQNDTIANETPNIETPSVQDIWAREDEIRKETQAREDTAYQRAVEDMRKAGINPNLVGVNPAASGGGITQASGQSTINTELNNIVEETLNKINNEVKMDEGQKDRTSDILRTLVMALLLKR